MKYLFVLIFSGYFCNSIVAHGELSAAKFVEYLRSVKSQDILDSRAFDSEQCAKHLELFVNELDKNTDWSLVLYDAWGKIPTGLYSGNRYDFGNFDQCLQVNVPNTFNGQYCLVDISTIKLPVLDDDDDDEDTETNSKSLNAMFGVYSELTKMMSLGIGVCVPDTCHPDYLKLVLNAFIVDYNITVENSFGRNCYTNETEPLSGLDIFAISFFAVFLGALIFSTAYDYIVIKTRQSKTEQPNQVFSLFSVYKNGKALFSLEKPKSRDVIECINGIRVLSLAWIVLSHAFVLLSIAAKLNDRTIVTEWVENPINMIILSATLAVDSFFLMGGFLVAKSVFRELDKTGRLNIFKMYIHRIIRITPVLATIILFVVSIYKYIGHGPQWSEYSSLIIEPCERNWWSTLIYLQNYLNSSDICIDESWYLAIDMQLFILSPLILYPLWKWKNKFVAVLPTLILAGIIYVSVIVYDNSFVITYFGNPDPVRRLDMVYHPTHARFGAWLVGVLLAYIMDTHKSVKFDNKYILSGWFLSLGTILAVIFGPYNMYQPGYIENEFDSPFYEPVSRVVWAISLGWIIFACHHNYGGAINTFLTMPIWRPLSKLSFCIYLLHTQMQAIHLGSSRTLKFWSNYEVIYTFFGDFAITFFVSILWTLAFEMPILNLEKIIFKRDNIKPPPLFNIPQINIIEDDSVEVITASEVNSGLESDPCKNNLQLTSKSALVPPLHVESRTDGHESEIDANSETSPGESNTRDVSVVLNVE